MSLRIWLPLNGSFHNQGLDGELNFSTAGTVSDADGKIGANSKYFNSSGIVSDYNLTLGNEASVCFWIYYTAFPSSSGNDWIFHLGTTTTGYPNTVFGLSTRYRDYFVLIAKGQHNDNNNERIEHNLSLNQWYHICFTWKNNDSAKLYINGNLYTTITNLNNGTKATIKKIALGMNSNASSTRLKGRLNDFRFYDHCLSAKEVKEISNGLILHYPLNYMNLINKDTLTRDTSINADGDTKNSSGWFATDFIPVLSNHTYQTYKLSTGGSNTYIAFYNNAKVKTRTVLIVANQDNTLIPDSTEAFIRLSIRNISNELTTALFYEIPTIIYDSSGYSNNGTVIGDLSAVVPSPRYNYATIFSNNCYIKKTDLVYNLNIWSASCWFKKTSTITSSFETMLGFTKGSGADANKKFSLYIKDNAVGFVGEQSSHGSIALIDKNLWHHVCITSDGIKHKYYLDGILKGTYDRTTNLTGCTDFVVGGRAATEDANNIGTPWGGNLSDIRFYTTALSDEDVLELYNTSGSIDSKGNIYARNFISQEDASFSISKNGIVVSPNFYECENNQASISNNNQKEIIGYQFYEY